MPYTYHYHIHTIFVVPTPHALFDFLHKPVSLLGENSFSDMVSHLDEMPIVVTFDLV